MSIVTFLRDSCCWFRTLLLLAYTAITLPDLYAARAANRVRASSHARDFLCCFFVVCVSALYFFFVFVAFRLLLSAFAFWLFALCFFVSARAVCLLLLVSLHFSFSFLLLAFDISFWMPISFCLRSPECLLLSAFIFLFLLTALNFPTAATFILLFLLFVSSFMLGVFRSPSCVTMFHEFPICS